MSKLRYIKVYWPESQMFFGHPRYNECSLTSTVDIDGEWQVLFVPEDLYDEVIKNG